MVYRTPNSSPSGSRSPSSATVSTDASPSSHSTPLTPISMVPSSEEKETQATQRVRGTASRLSVDSARPQSASRGGCWTCRLRRKKCDEQREGDSCRTCLRLGIDCLGWGSRRPDWMRDKQEAERFKAAIKAKLTRAGLIRGQPRSSLNQAPPTPTISPQTQRPYSQIHITEGSSSTPSVPVDLDKSNIDFGYRFMEPHGHHRQPHPMVPAMSSSGPSFQPPPMLSYNTPGPSLSTMDLNPPFFQMPTSSPSTGHLPFDFPNTSTGQEHSGYGYDLRFSSLLPNQNIQGDYVIYYFEHVRKVEYIFAGNTITNVTYQLILEQPQGAVTNAVCALAILHSSRMRVARGFEAPDTGSEPSTAKYYHDEAYFQVMNAKQLQGYYDERDAIAALHLVSFSMLSGGMTDWRPVLRIACDWLAQTGLPNDENPKLTVSGMSQTGQLVVKVTAWLDIFSSLTLMCPPRYFGLYKRLFGEDGGYWTGHLQSGALDFQQGGLRMEALSGCPDEAMLGIAEVSALAHWKATEQRKSSLSVRELIRRGDAIEQRLQTHRSDPPKFADMDQVPLHPNLLQTSSLAEPSQGTLAIPNDAMRLLVAKIFHETVLLYLHTVLNDSNPAVVEIRTSVDEIVQLLNQLPPTEVDRSLVFPICLAGCLTDDASQRDYLKGRLQAQNECVGNLMQTRALMEAVWQKRDVSGGTIDWRDSIRERSPNLLLV